MAQAKKIDLFELNIDTSDLVKSMADSRAEVKRLSDEIKKLSKDEKANGEEIAQLTTARQLEQKELRNTQKETKALLEQQDKNLGTLEKLTAENTKLRAERQKLNLETDEGKKRLSEINSKLDINSKFLAENSDKAKKAKLNVGNYTESINKSAVGLDALSPRLSSAATKIKAFGLAFKTALGPIGLILSMVALLISSLKAFFTSSEEGQNALKRLQAVFDVVFGNMSDVLSTVGKKMFDLFTSPKKALKGFSNLLKSQIINRFKGLLELLPELSKAISLVFEGEFKKAAKTAADAGAKVTLGVEDFTDKAVNGYNAAADAVKKFTAEQEKEIAIAQQLADTQAKLNKTIRTFGVANAKAAQNIAEFRNKAAQKETFTAEERLKFLDEALKLENEILVRNESIAATKLKIQQEQNALSNSTAEDLDKENNLLIQLINTRTTNAEKTRRLQSERLSAIREIKAEELALEREIEYKKLIAEEDRLKKSVELNRQYAAAKEEDNKNLANKLKERADAEQQAQIINAENDLAIAEQFAIEKFKLQQKALSKQRQQEIENAKATGADIERINKKFDAAELDLEQRKKDYKLKLASDFAGNIATIAGEGTAVGKAAAIAQATIDTYRAANASYAALSGIGIIGPVLGAAAAGAAIVSGFKNVKNILSVDSGLPEKNISSTIPSGAASIPTQTINGEEAINQSISAQVGQGIIGRETLSDAQTQQNKAILVVDEVTAKQQEQASNVETSNI